MPDLLELDPHAPELDKDLEIHAYSSAIIYAVIGEGLENYSR